LIETSIKKQESLPEYTVGSINDLRPSEDTLRNLGEFLATRYKKIKSLREHSEWEKEKGEAFKKYHMVKKERALPFPGAANMPSPLSRIGTDAFHANVMSSLFFNGKQLKIVPGIVPKDFANTALKAANFMTYVMNEEADSYMVIDDADKKAQMYGIAYIEPCYVKDEVWETVEITEKKQIPTVDPMTQEITYQETVETRREKKKRTVFDGIRMHSLPVESIYKSPFFQTLDEAVREDAVFKLFKISFAKIKEGTKTKDDRPSFYLKGQVDKLMPSITQKMTAHLTKIEQDRAVYDGFYIDMLSQEEMVEMVEGHLWYDIDGDGIKEEITATFHPDLATVIRVSLTPCRIVDVVPRPIDGRGHGEGIPKICEVLDEEWENFHNTRANAGQWENTTFGFYRAGGRLNPTAITVQPGRFYPVDDPREISFPNVPRVGSSYFQEEGLILNYFERIFALDENIQGVSSQRTQTATETIRVSSKASVRFSNPFNRIVNAIDRLVKHCWELSRDCAPPTKEFYVTGEGGDPIFDKMDRYDFSANFKFSTEVSSIFDQQLVRDTMLLSYRLFLVNPFVQQHPEVLWSMSQKTLRALNVDVDLPKPPQAKTLSPFEEHELFKRGEDPEPEVGEDADYHLQCHEAVLASEEVKNWPPEAVQKLIIHRDKTMILKKTLESANLNKSGMYTGGPMPEQPGLTVSRNPSEMFNKTRVGETGNSMKQNVQNGQGGNPNVEQNLNQVFGNSVS
jgi:hypothetical protein